MSSRRTYRVKEVARLTGVSVRALHHYDAIGLLEPTYRTEAGYRLYTERDLLRLQQILLGRELGFGLAEIRRSFEDPDFDERRALLRQRAALKTRAEETARLIRAVDRALELLGAQDSEGAPETQPLTSHHEHEGEDIMDLKEIFDGFDPARYEKEAEERWGHTDAYRESTRRAQSYTAEDWKRMKEEQAAIYAAAFELLERGVDPTSDAALDVAERHRLSIDRWFYPCSPAMHAGLADLYENDVRFAENIDRHGPGLTGFLIAAIRANAARARTES